MIKYKLIEKYPGSLPLGSISKLDYSEYPKNWEPFVENEYEIVATRLESGAVLYYKDGVCVSRTDEFLPRNTVNLSVSLANRREIFSLKRLIDNKVFTVGDTVKASNNHIFTIVSFNVSSKGVAYASCSNDLYSPSIVINCLEKVEKVLYTTFDGVKRYTYQEEHWVINNKYAYVLKVCNLHLESCLKDRPNTYKIFSSKQAALEYEKMNTAEFTRKQVIELLESRGLINTGASTNVTISYTIIKNNKNE